jgi:hypothetical protein
MPIRAFCGVWEDCKGINVKCPWNTKNIRNLFFKVGLLSLPLITDYSKLDIYFAEVDCARSTILTNS